ncbi:MAG: recombination mediator RecR [Bacilli bacterium]
MYPDSLKKVVDSFKLFPGIGERTAERLAFSVLNMETENVENIAKNLINLQKNIKKCKTCNVLTDEDTCNICSNTLRDSTILCIVDDSKSIFLFEKMGIYNGLYHVLDGLISPIDGITPDDIGLDKLITRIKKGNFKEIVLAVKPSVEGETTSLYIKRILEDMNIKISKIASGIPMGADIEYLDVLTLERALKDRTTL